MNATEETNPSSGAARRGAAHAKAPGARANAHAAHPGAKTVDE